MGFCGIVEDKVDAVERSEGSAGATPEPVSAGGWRNAGKRVLLPLLLCFSAWAAFGQQHRPALIDVHEHFNGEPGVLDRLLGKLNRVDGMGFLLVTPKGMAQARQAIADHPNRFAGICDLNIDAPRVLDQVDRCQRAGFIGLGEITTTLRNYDDRAYWPVYERAQRYHMILLFHTGIVQRLTPEIPQDASFDRMRSTRLDLIARRFPKLIVIGAHLGNPDYAESAEIARWNPNLYFDLSGSSLIKTKGDYTIFRSIFWWSGVVSPHTPGAASAFSKLVFGSDVFGGDSEEFDRELDRYHKMLDACGQPADVQQLVFSGNVWRILERRKADLAAAGATAGRVPGDGAAKR